MRRRSGAAFALLVVLCLPLPSLGGTPLAVDLRDGLAACPANGCEIQLERGVYEIAEPIWIGRLGERTNGWKIRGRGRGIFSSGAQRTNCATTLRYVGPYTNGAMVNVASTRYGAIEELCLDLNGRAAGDIEFHCTASTTNCGDFRVAVVSGGWPAGYPVTFGPRALPASDGQEHSWEAVTFDHYQQHYAEGAATMAPPRIGMHLGIRNADHWHIQSSKLAFTGDGAGILVEAGNFTLIETIIRSDSEATSESCAVKVESESDRLAIIGLTTELKGQANGICGCRPDGAGGCAPAIMAVSITGSEIKVPKGSTALDWRLGGSLALSGTVLGYHGAGEGRIGVHIEPTKQLQLLDNFYRMSLLDVTIAGEVVR